MLRAYLLAKDASLRTELYPVLAALVGNAFSGIAQYIAIGDLEEALAAAAGKDSLAVVLPDGTPPGALLRLVATHLACRFVVAGPNDARQLRDAMAHGAAGYLRQASAAADLREALPVVLNGGTWLPPVTVSLPAGKILTNAGPLPADFFKATSAEQLTRRQREILALIRDGKSNTEISDALGLTTGTVKIHITAIFKALGVKNRTQAIVAAQTLGL